MFKPFFVKAENAGLTVGDFCGSVCVDFLEKVMSEEKYLKLR